MTGQPVLCVVRGKRAGISSQEPTAHLRLIDKRPCCFSPQALTDLAGISSQEAIAASRTAAALRGRRFAIRLCRASYELLAQHLQVRTVVCVVGFVVNCIIVADYELPA